MIHILFLILKIIGWILLFLLVILLLLILTILFYPVKYRFSAKGENTLDTLVAYGKVSWLFHLISGSASYEHGELKWKLRLAWKKFDSSEEEQKETSEKPVVSEPLEKEPLEGKKTEVKNNPPEKDVKIEKASEKEPEIKKESETEKTKVREERRPENVQTESKLKKIYISETLWYYKKSRREKRISDRFFNLRESSTGIRGSEERIMPSVTCSEA